MSGQFTGAAGPQAPAAQDTTQASAVGQPGAEPGDVIAGEDLVEEVSIDGMCGVY